MVREEVLELVRQRLVRFASSRAGRETAEDVAQETLLLLTTKYPHLDQAADLVPLSMRIARLKLMNHWRKVKRAPMVAVDEPEAEAEAPLRSEGTETALVRKMQVDDLLRAIDQLGERCRRLLQLKLEGRDFEEIRDRLSAATLNTVYTWDNRCRKQLREALVPAWEGSAGG